jgi:lysophospholipase L1-like esterase
MTHGGPVASEHRPPLIRRLVPVVFPALVGLGFQLAGHPFRALVLWTFAALVLVLVLAGVPVERYVARFAAAVARGVSYGLGLAIGMLLIAAGGVLRLLRRDPLRPRGWVESGWHPSTRSDDSDRLATKTFGLERMPDGPLQLTGGRGRAVRRVVVIVGSIVSLMLLDVGVGAGWERLSRSDGALGPVVDAINLTGRTDTRADPRADLPAMSEYPWADAYFREIQQTPYSYWPFTESRPRDFVGEFVNQQGWSRRSYESEETNRDTPVVWMFGGSTTWGEGQRDEHTIASHLARIAEREGVPLRVVNFGQRGWTHFQEMILFEQLAAEGPPPDVALFYDGANEINAQTLGAKGVPTHTLVDQYAERLTGGIADEFLAPAPDPPSTFALAWDAYASRSALHKLVRRVRDVVDPAVGAAEVAHTGEDGGGGQGTMYDKGVEDAQRAVDVYERGRTLTAALAEQYGVRPLFFWQPVVPGVAEHWANANVSEPTINISDVLDEHRDVYIDGGHHNEEGARIVAERIWVDLQPTLEAARGG